MSDATRGVHPSRHRAASHREWYPFCEFDFTRVVSLLIFLISFAAISGSFIFVFVCEKERILCDSLYELAAAKILRGAETTAQRAGFAAASLSAVYSNKYTHAAQWPDVDVNSLATFITHVKDISEVDEVVLIPMTSPFDPKSSVHQMKISNELLEHLLGGFSTDTPSDSLADCTSFAGSGDRVAGMDATIQVCYSAAAVDATAVSPVATSCSDLDQNIKSTIMSESYERKSASPLCAESEHSNSSREESPAEKRAGHRVESDEHHPSPGAKFDTGTVPHLREGLDRLVQCAAKRAEAGGNISIECKTVVESIGMILVVTDEYDDSTEPKSDSESEIKGDRAKDRSREVNEGSNQDQNDPSKGAASRIEAGERAGLHIILPVFPSKDPFVLAGAVYASFRWVKLLESCFAPFSTPSPRARTRGRAPAAGNLSPILIAESDDDASEPGGDRGGGGELTVVIRTAGTSVSKNNHPAWATGLDSSKSDSENGNNYIHGALLTYRIVGEAASFVGFGDFHDRSFEPYGKSVPLFPSADNNGESKERKTVPAAVKETVAGAEEGGKDIGDADIKDSRERREGRDELEEEVPSSSNPLSAYSISVYPTRAFFDHHRPGIALQTTASIVGTIMLAFVCAMTACYLFLNLTFPEEIRRRRELIQFE